MYVRRGEARLSRPSGNHGGNRSRGGSRGDSDRESGRDLRRESDRETRRVSACSSRVEFHGKSEVDWRVDLQNLCRGDLRGLLLGVSRFGSQIRFHRGLHGDLYRDLRMARQVLVPRRGHIDGATRGNALPRRPQSRTCAKWGQSHGALASDSARYSPHLAGLRFRGHGPRVV